MTGVDGDDGASLEQTELLARLPAAIYRTTPDGRILFANHALARLFGFDSVDELLAVPAGDLYADPADRERLVEGMLHDAIPASVEVPMRRRDGSELWARMTPVAIRSPKGELQYLEGVIEDVTERRRTEEALRASEELLRRAFADAPQGLAILGPDLRLIQANRSFARMLGRSIEEILGTEALAFLHPDELADAESRAAAILADDVDTYQVQRRMLHADGHAVPVLIAGAVVRGTGGELLAVVSQLFDISDRVRAEERLAESEERFRAAFDNAPVGMVVIGADLRVQRINPALQEMLGIDPAAAIGAHVFELVPDAQVEDAARRLERIATGEIDSYRTERRALHGDGRELEVIVETAGFRDAAGRLAGYVSQTIDVTDLKAAERALADSEDLFRSIFDGSPIPISLRAPDMTFERANPAMLRLMRMSAAEMAEFDLATALTASGLRRLRETFDALAAGELGPPPMELRITRPDGSAFWALVSMTSIRDRTGAPRGVLSHLVEITERKLAEERLMELVRSKDELIASVSHELRTPLTTVVGLAQELRDRAASFSTQEHQELIGLVAGQAEEMADLIDDLLVAAHDVAGVLEVQARPVDLAAEVQAVVRSTPHPVEAVVAGQADRKCWADPFRLRQILRNLVSNAVKYGSPPITLEVGAAGAPCSVLVRDGGPGLPPAEWEAIFRRYYRAHRAGRTPGGVGLGLSLSRDLARAMGGDLTYRVEDGASVFELTLPPSVPPS